MSRLWIVTDDDLSEEQMRAINSTALAGLGVCARRISAAHDMNRVSASLLMLSLMVGGFQNLDAAACSTLLSAMDRLGRAELEGRTDAAAQRDYEAAHTALLEAADLAQQPTAGRG